MENIVKDLKGRVAVVTGGASGIGQGMIRAFASEGMKIVIADIEVEARDKAASDLANDGAEVIAVECDVSSAASVEAVRDEALSAFGAVHVVCNNAGVAGGQPGPIWAAPQSDWDWVLGVNLLGVVHGVQTFVPLLIEQGQGGHIVNTASLAGLMEGAGIYGVSKQAVVGLTESLWRDLKATESGVSASVLCPAWVRTRIMESERNRPEAPRPNEEIPAEAQALRDIVRGLIEKDGLDPEDVGRQVARSIKDDKFYILTHPGWNNIIRNRMENILAGRDPVTVPPEGGDLPIQ
jgi:NAD(P)-dependent dehydrogenase (short-subunit alcohol dehydrogenase family)